MSHPQYQQEFGQTRGTPSNAASSLVVNSMKYLRNTPQRNDSGTNAQKNQVNMLSTSFGQKASNALNSSSSGLAHSNVLLKAQNIQNRNDSFGISSSYSQ